jgi:transcriptional regulator with XRE-family HTH domain
MANKPRPEVSEKESYTKKVSEVVINAMRQTGMSQVKLTKLIGINQSQLSKFLRGIEVSISMNLLEELENWALATLNGASNSSANRVEDAPTTPKSTIDEMSLASRQDIDVLVQTVPGLALVLEDPFAAEVFAKLTASRTLDVREIARSLGTTSDVVGPISALLVRTMTRALTSQLPQPQPSEAEAQSISVTSSLHFQSGWQLPNSTAEVVL